MNIWLAEVWRAWRASLRRPGFLLLATGVLALGIGASVAVFTLIGNTLMRPIPVPHASELVVLGHLSGSDVGYISPHEYQYLTSLKRVTSVGLEQAGSVVNVAGSGTPQQVPAIRADRHLLPTLGLQPVLGRDFSSEEDSPNGPKVILLSYGLWQRSYAGDRGVIGRLIQVEGVTYTIVGVLPAAFNAVVGAGDIVLPLALPPISHDYNQNFHRAIARLADGASIAAVAAEVDAHERAMYRDMAMGGNWKQPRFGAQSLASVLHRDARPTLMLFLASALLVLLIALVNLTNLMLLRALARNHDVAVRSALGAPMLRLLLPAVGEGLLVGLGGALCGMLLAIGALASLQQFIPAEWMRGGHLQIAGVAWLLAFVLGLLSAVLAAGLALWRSRSATSVDELREGGRSGIGAHRGRLGRGLVVAQVALATVLLCAAGVFMHALYNASQLQLGFASDNILTFELAPVQADYPDVASLHALSDRLVQRLQAIPGVTHAAVTSNLPVSDVMFGQFNSGAHTATGKALQVQYHGVGRDFFKLFGIPVHRGRAFSPDDVQGGVPVAIVSQDLADKLYDGHALGNTIQADGNSGTVYPVRTIVGVVGSTYQLGPLQPGQPMMYVPLAQFPATMMTVFRRYEPLRFALRGQGRPADWRVGVRAALAEVAPRQPIANVRSLHSIVKQTTQDARLSMLLIGLFASLALLLAVAGMYAVMAVAVAAREREFGVRTALGASPARLIKLVLRGGMAQIGIGLVLGVGLALAVAQVLAHASTTISLLGQFGALDPAVVIGVCVLLALSGLLACLLPAVRAGRVHPMRALRGD